MKKGTTSQAVALAAALLGTTFLVTPTEAQARRYDGVSSQGSYERTTNVTRKKVTQKKRYTKNRKYTKNRSYQRAAQRAPRASARIPQADRRALYVNNAPRRAVQQRQVAQQLPRCGFLEFGDHCTHDVNAAPARTQVQSSSPSLRSANHMRQANSMVGMHARSHRGDLQRIFASTLNKPVDPVRTPWCAAWANAVLQKSGIQGTGSLLARSFLNWGSATSTPKEGDVVVMSRGRSRVSGHVGFFVERQVVNGRRYVKVLGGNQGKQVAEGWYPESRVLGYRRVS